MATTKVTEIRNLTQATPLETELTKFKLSKDGNSFKVVAKDVTDEEIKEDFAEAEDNIQVTWTDNGGKTHRAVRGRLVLKDKTATISNLLDVSKYRAQVSGKLGIGPNSNPNAAQISVSIGNLNEEQDWIINLSDKQDGDTGSAINFKALIEWINTKNKEEGRKLEPPTDSASTEGNDGKKSLNDFTIEFKEFYFNITQKTFDIWVASKADEEIAFGAFTIKKVSVRVTNVYEPSQTSDNLKSEITNGKHKEIGSANGKPKTPKLLNDKQKEEASKDAVDAV
jgi:hypothetical protein